MKTTVDIADSDLEAARKLTGAKSPEEAVAKAVEGYLRERQQRLSLANQLYGSMPDFMTQADLHQMREEP